MPARPALKQRSGRRNACRRRRSYSKTAPICQDRGSSSTPRGQARGHAAAGGDELRRGQHHAPEAELQQPRPARMRRLTPPPLLMHAGRAWQLHDCPPPGEALASGSQVKADWERKEQHAPVHVGQLLAQRLVRHEHLRGAPLTQHRQQLNGVHSHSTLKRPAASPCSASPQGMQGSPVCLSSNMPIQACTCDGAAGRPT